MTNQPQTRIHTWNTGSGFLRWARLTLIVPRYLSRICFRIGYVLVKNQEGNHPATGSVRSVNLKRLFYLSWAGNQRIRTLLPEIHKIFRIEGNAPTFKELPSKVKTPPVSLQGFLHFSCSMASIYIYQAWIEVWDLQQSHGKNWLSWQLLSLHSEVWQGSRSRSNVSLACEDASGQS